MCLLNLIIIFCYFHISRIIITMHSCYFNISCYKLAELWPKTKNFNKISPSDAGNFELMGYCRVDISERLKRFARKGAKRSMHSLTRFVGERLKSHDLFEAAGMKVITCYSVSGLKDWKEQTWGTGVKVREGEFQSAAEHSAVNWMRLILSRKKKKRGRVPKELIQLSALDDDMDCPKWTRSFGRDFQS